MVKFVSYQDFGLTNQGKRGAEMSRWTHLVIVSFFLCIDRDVDGDIMFGDKCNLVYMLLHLILQVHVVVVIA